MWHWGMWVTGGLRSAGLTVWCDDHTAVYQPVRSFRDSFPEWSSSHCHTMVIPQQLLFPYTISSPNKQTNFLLPLCHQPQSCNSFLTPWGPSYSYHLHLQLLFFASQAICWTPNSIQYFPQSVARHFSNLLHFPPYWPVLTFSSLWHLWKEDCYNYETGEAICLGLFFATRMESILLLTDPRDLPRGKKEGINIWLVY